MQVVGVIPVGIDSSFGEFEEGCIPPRDPNGGIRSNRSGGIGDIKDPRKGVTHRANQ